MGLIAALPALVAASLYPGELSPSELEQRVYKFYGGPPEPIGHPELDLQALEHYYNVVYPPLAEFEQGAYRDEVLMDKRMPTFGVVWLLFLALAMFGWLRRQRRA